MANIIKPKRSESTGQTPTLSPGELAVNIADKKVWVADSSGTPVLIVDGNASISETDPVFSASPAYSISTIDISGWNAKPDNVAITSNGLITITNNTSGNNISYNLDLPQGIATTDSPTFAGLTAAGLVYPTTDGTSGQVIVTDGAGNLSFATASSGGTPGGSSGQLQWNNSGSFDGVSESTYSTSSTIVLQLSQTTNTKTPLVITRNASPSADIFYWADSSLNINGGINSSGNMYFAYGFGASFRDSSGNEIVLTAPSSGSNWTMRLPAADGTNGQVLKTNGAGQLSFTDVITNLSGGSGGSIPYQSSASTTSMLPNGTSGQILKANGGTSAPSWVAQSTLTVGNLTGGNSTTLLGSIPYQSNTNTTSLLSPNTTTTKKFLRQTGTGTNGAAPAWDTVTASDVGLGNVTNTAQVTSVTGTSPVASSGGTTPAISLASGYGDTQNPYASKSANYVLAAPNGLAGVPTFRALVAADIPTLNQNTTGSSGSCTGNSATATKSTNLIGGNSTTLLGSIPYQSNTDTTTLLGPNTTSTKKYLAQTGTGTNGAAPTWSQPAVTEISASTAGGAVYSTASALAVTAAGTSGQVLRSNGSSAPTWEAQGFFSGGRLTLTSATPITTTDVTAATTLYFTPYGLDGDKISLYDGTNWATYTFSQLSLALGTLSSGFNYDVFVYNNGGTLTLETAIWTNDTTRATSLTLTNGIYLKTGALTRRYLGTFRTTSTTTTEDSIAKRFVWNFNNRVEKALYKNGTTSHTYTTASWRNWNNDATLRIEFILGIDAAQVIHFGGAATGTGIDIGAGFDGGSPGYDSVNSTGTGVSQTRGGRAYSSRGTFLGYHYCQMQEYGASGTTFLDARLEGTIWC